MPPKGIGIRAVLAHPAPHSGSCAGTTTGRRRPTPCRSETFHDCSRDLSCANNFSPPRDERLSGVASFPVAGAFHYSTQRTSRIYRPRLPNDCQLSRPDSDNDAHRYAAVDPDPLTGFLSEKPHQQPHLLSASHTDDPDTSVMSIAGPIRRQLSNQSNMRAATQYPCKRYISPVPQFLHAFNVVTSVSAPCFSTTKHLKSLPPFSDHNKQRTGDIHEC